MEEIKRRIGVIQLVLGRMFAIDERTSEEFCLIHLRMICELIAIGCLVVHGDIKEVQGKIKGLYQADVIMRALGKLHPNFYPRPGKQVRNLNGSIEVHDVTSGYLTKGDLSTLYHRCSAALHIGSLREFPTNWNRTIDLPAIEGWCAKIMILLSHHQISLVRKDLEVWTIMNGEGGRVYAHLFKKIGPGPAHQNADRSPEATDE